MPSGGRKQPHRRAKQAGTVYDDGDTENIEEEAEVAVVDPAKRPGVIHRDPEGDGPGHSVAFKTTPKHLWFGGPGHCSRCRSLCFQSVVAQYRRRQTVEAER